MNQLQKKLRKVSNYMSNQTEKNSEKNFIKSVSKKTLRKNSKKFVLIYIRIKNLYSFILFNIKQNLISSINSCIYFQ